MPDSEAADNCIAVLGRLAPMAEAHGVTIVVELLNSKVDHADSQGDHTDFGVKVHGRTNSSGKYAITGSRRRWGVPGTMGGTVTM